MEYLIIFNFLISISTVGYFIYEKFPFHLSVNKTFWCKKVYSITLMMRTSGNRRSYSAKGIFTLPIRNYKKLIEWDDKMYESGEYKRCQYK
jgi:hypothetical protein